MTSRAEAAIGCGIDVGTNTVRMLIAEVSDGRIVKTLYSGRAITRLGAGLAQTGRLSPTGAGKTLELFRSFKYAIDEYNVKHIFAAATSAVREASDSAEFLAAAKAVGIPLVTISGEEEARYTYKGVASGLEDACKPILIYDIGGGSTEVIYAGGGGVRFAKSVPVGVVKLADRFDFSGVVSPAVISECSVYVNGLLRPVFEELRLVSGGFEGPPVGTAGTVTAIAAVDMEMEIYDPEAVNRHILTCENLALISGRLSAVSAPERLAVKGVEQGREDLLIPGIVMIMEILGITGCDRSAVSDSGLREGLTVAAVS